MQVNKKEFIKQLVTKHHYTKKAATALVDDFLDMVTENLENGNTVFFYGFGCFDMVERAERACLLPGTQTRHVIASHWVPRFYPGNTLKRVVKVWEDNVKRGMV